jgi:hypothetical protein
MVEREREGIMVGEREGLDGRRERKRDGVNG